VLVLVVLIVGLTRFSGSVDDTRKREFYVVEVIGKYTVGEIPSYKAYDTYKHMVDDMFSIITCNEDAQINCWKITLSLPKQLTSIKPPIREDVAETWGRCR
jgi:hypothetical protein